jgi:hypothetical protein
MLMPEDTNDYELLPHKEIEELKKELESLKEIDVTPTKKLHISVIELNRNISKLLDIFEESLHQIKVEEGGLMFSEKIKPLMSRMDRLEKNIETVADVLSNVIAPTLSDIHDKLMGVDSGATLPPPPGGLPPPAGLPPGPL